jgi:hypothetical protein
VVGGSARLARGVRETFDAAIIGIQAVMKSPNAPSSVATPMSMPSIRSIATTQDTAASASVVTAAAPHNAGSEMAIVAQRAFCADHTA